MNGTAWAHGYLGVDVFLVISGYLLFRSRLSAPGKHAARDIPFGSPLDADCTEESLF